MNVKEAILDLISNDSYLLWEVRGATKDFGDFDEIIRVSVDLVKSNEAICSSAPILKREPQRMLSTQESVLELKNPSNWLPPKSDYVNAIWLRLPNTNSSITRSG